MEIFFNNLNLAPMQKHLSYKSVNKMSIWLTELQYGKITRWRKSISISSVIANVALIEYLIYYLNII